MGGWSVLCADQRHKSYSRFCVDLGGRRIIKKQNGGVDRQDYFARRSALLRTTAILMTVL
eukprot:COSAG02_NODE_44805_length_363_cov_0.371212_1_plen_59_part_10